jgi:UDP-glucose 6-dehydrogenase
MMENETANLSGSVIEILTLSLKPNTRDKFHQLYTTESLPLLKKWKIEVVAHGPSRHDENTYYVIRSFKSLADRQKVEDAFYSSDDWRTGPRSAILALIEHEAYVVIPTEKLKEWSDSLAV